MQAALSPKEQPFFKMKIPQHGFIYH